MTDAQACVVLRAFYLAGQPVQKGAVLQLQPSLAAELRAYGKVVPAPAAEAAPAPQGAPAGAAPPPIAAPAQRASRAPRADKGATA